MTKVLATHGGVVRTLTIGRVDEAGVAVPREGGAEVRSVTIESPDETRVYVVARFGPELIEGMTVEAGRVLGSI